MNKYLLFILVFMLAVAAPAAVKKKRFDVGGASDAPAATEATVESVAPAEPENPRSIYTVIAE